MEFLWVPWLVVMMERTSELNWAHQLGYHWADPSAAQKESHWGCLMEPQLAFRMAVHSAALTAAPTARCWAGRWALRRVGHLVSQLVTRKADQTVDPWGF